MSVFHSPRRYPDAYRYTVVRQDNHSSIAAPQEYRTASQDIRYIAAHFGHTQDTLELYNENDRLIARAIWDDTKQHYRYSTGDNLKPWDPDNSIYTD